MAKDGRGGISIIIFPEVIATMKAAGITQMALASILDIAPRSLRNKLTGKTPLSLDEAIAIRDSIAPGRDLEELFQKGG